MLKRTMHHLKTVVRRLGLSEEDMKAQSEIARRKLDALKVKSEAVLEELIFKLNAESKQMCNELSKYMQCENCKRKITCDWNVGEIPTVDSGLGDWTWIRERIHQAFYDRLIECVDDWNTDERRIDVIAEELSSHIKFDLRLLEEELNDIEMEIQCDTSSTSSDELSALSRSRRKSMPIYSMTKSKFMIPEPKMPLKLAGRVIAPFKTMLSPIKNKIKASEYKDNPVRVAEKCARNMYSELISEYDGSLTGFIPLAEYLLERPRDYVEAVERRVPDMILANQLLLNRLEEGLEVERMHQAEYEEMMTSVETLKRSLMEYGEGYIFVADFNRGELQIQQMPMEGGEAVSVAFNVTDFIRGSSRGLDVCRRRDIRGLWTVTYLGSLNRNGIDRPVAIKVYLPSSGVEFTYKEVAKLRYI